MEAEGWGIDHVRVCRRRIEHLVVFWDLFIKKLSGFGIRGQSGVDLIEDLVEPVSEGGHEGEEVAEQRGGRLEAYFGTGGRDALVAGLVGGGGGGATVHDCNRADCR